MKSINFTILLFFLIAVSLQAGTLAPIKKDDKTAKSLKFSIDIKESSKDKNKYAVKIEVGHKVSYLSSFYVFTKNKKYKKSYKPIIKDSKAIIEFEIDKKTLLESHLNFSYPNLSNCPSFYTLEFKDFLNETIAKKDSK